MSDELDDVGDSETDEWGGVALEAHVLVHGDRGAVYDHPYFDYSRVVGAFNALTGLGLEVSHGPVFMLCVKMARGCTAIDNGLPAELWRDSRVDTAGYAECWDGVVTYEVETLDDADDDDDDDGDDEPPPPPAPDDPGTPINDGDDRAPLVVPPVLADLIGDMIDAPFDDDEIDITSNQAPPPTC